jgi:hypothetical protein
VSVEIIDTPSKKSPLSKVRDSRIQKRTPTRAAASKLTNYDERSEEEEEDESEYDMSQVMIKPEPAGFANVDHSRTYSNDYYPTNAYANDNGSFTNYNDNYVDSRYVKREEIFHDAENDMDDV